MNLALIGSVSSSWTVLDALIRGGVEITCVLGVSESEARRISDYRDLSWLADRAGIPFRSFVKVTEPEVAAFLRRHQPDMLWVIGLSQLVPESLLRIAPHGGVGFHPTPLPKGRGRAPVAWTLLLGVPAAASLFFLADEADAGDIIGQRDVPVLPDDYSEDLIKRTNEVLAEMVLDLAPAIQAGTLPRRPQDHRQATFYPKRTPEDGLIHWDQPTDQIYRLIRAAGRPYPGAFTYARREKITVWRAKPDEGTPARVTGGTTPGTIMAARASGQYLVATGDGAICLTEVQISPRRNVRSLLAVGTVLTGLSGSTP